MDVIDVNFQTYWEEEQDWLVEVVMLPQDDEPEDLEPDLEFIGKLFAFSMATNTRILAQVGDPAVPAYELWFSFTGEEEKETFLQLVREDGYADPDEETEFKPPSPEALRSDIRNLRPIGHVFPKNQSDKIIAYGMMTAMAMGVDTGQQN